MTALRRLSPRGITAFREYLASIRAGTEFQSNPALLYVDDFSAPVKPRIDVEQRRFRTKLDAAKYLNDILDPLDAIDASVWSWLALYYFDQLAPVGSDGKRRPRNDYHYIPNDRYRERHLLAGPFHLYRLHRESSRILLSRPVHQHGTFILNLDRDLLTNRGFIELADLLYWKKRNATNADQPGTLRRLIAVMRQLEFNYDVYGMSATELMALLPEEFEPWKPTGARPSLVADRVS